jgi:hypothetical protein
MSVGHQPPLPFAPSISSQTQRKRKQKSHQAALGPFLVPCIPGDVSFLRCRRPRPSAEYMMQEMHHRHPRSTTYRHDNLRNSLFHPPIPSMLSSTHDWTLYTPALELCSVGGVDNNGYACIEHSFLAERSTPREKKKRKKKSPRNQQSHFSISPESSTEAELRKIKSVFFLGCIDCITRGGVVRSGPVSMPVVPPPVFARVLNDSAGREARQS